MFITVTEIQSETRKMIRVTYTTYMFTLLFLYFSTSKVDRALCTIDINLSQLEYLAGHLDPSECRRLVAALHYNSFELPESISGAERKVNDDIPCLRQLLHWNSSPGEGRGQTHEDVEHRLRQLKHNDLADWLGKTTFKQLRNDLDRALRNPFSDQESEDTVDIRVGSNDSTSGETTESTDQPPEEDPWLPVDTLMLATLSLSLTALAVICVLLVFHHVRLSLEQRNNNSAIDQEKGERSGSIVRGEKQKKKKRIKKRKKQNTSITLSDSKKNLLPSTDSLPPLQKKKRCCGVSCNIL